MGWQVRARRYAAVAAAGFACGSFGASLASRWSPRAVAAAAVDWPVPHNLPTPDAPSRDATIPTLDDSGSEESGSERGGDPGSRSPGPRGIRPPWREPAIPELRRRPDARERKFTADASPRGENTKAAGGVPAALGDFILTQEHSLPRILSIES